MSEVLCPGLLHRETEFVIARDPVLGTTARRFGTCGQQAAHAVLSNARNRYISTAEIYTAMRDRGLCDPSGASTASALQTICEAYGAGIVGFHQWTDSNWTNWLGTFTQYAGVVPFLFETHAGQVLIDLITGAGENANNLENHFIAVLGRHTGGFSTHAGRDLPSGFWCADGCSFAGGNDNAHNFNAANMLQFYSDTAIAASLPRALVAVKGASMGVPSGWKDSASGDASKAGTLTAPNGKVCTMGMRYTVLSATPQWPSDNVPQENVHFEDQVMAQKALGFGAVQTFYRSRLYWLKSSNTMGEVPLGAEVLAVEAENATLKARIAQLEAAGTGDPVAADALTAIRALKAVEAKA